jgi:hypothetical protein
MKPLLKIILPSHQNNVQRAGFFVSLAAIAITIFLHFPFDGYTIREWEPNMNRHLCPTEEEFKTAERNAKYYERLEHCYPGEEKIQPFSEWRSNNPIVHWLGSTLHVSVTVALWLAIGILWIILFRKP